MAIQESESVRVDLDNLSKKDKDILTLDAQALNKKYKLSKQQVYGRRYTLNRKIKDAGLSVDDVIGNGEQQTERSPRKSTTAKKTRSKSVVNNEAQETNGKPLVFQFGDVTVRVRGKIENLSVDGNTLDIHV